MKEKKIICFDMDGTVTDLYGFKNWLPLIRAEDVTPFIEAVPLLDMQPLNDVLNELRGQGWGVRVVTWLPKGGHKPYTSKVRQAKSDWLQRHGMPIDNIHIVKYGTTKANAVRKYASNAVLIDDNQQILKGWHLGATIDPTRQDVVYELKKLLIK